MSEFKISKILNDMVEGPVASTVVRITYKSEDGILGCYGTSAVSVLNDEAADTYSPGCLYIRVNGVSSIVYINEAAAGAVSSFQELTGTAAAVVGIQAGYQAGTAGDPGPSPLIWDGAPLFEVMLNPEKGYFLFEDFNANLTVAEIAGTLTQTAGAGTFTDDPTAAGGVSVLDNAANTANDATNLAFLAMQCKPGVGTHIYFEARVQVGVDDGGIIIGLMDDGTTDPVGSGTIVTNTDHAVFFRDTGTGAAAMGTQACDGTNVTSSDLSISDVDKDSYEIFGIHIFGNGDTAGDYVKFYHEGVLVATVTDADGGGDDGVPDAIICPTFSIDNIGDTTQMLARIDWMRVLVYNATAGTARA